MVLSFYYWYKMDNIILQDNLSFPIKQVILVLSLDIYQMKNLLGHLWSDEAGFVLSAELVLISSVAVIGVVAAGAIINNNNAKGRAFA